MKWADVKAFAVAFARAMNDRDNILTAFRQFAIGVAVATYFLGVIALSQTFD